jgi:hypothetical protein
MLAAISWICFLECVRGLRGLGRMASIEIDSTCGNCVNMRGSIKRATAPSGFELWDRNCFTAMPYSLDVTSAVESDKALILR